jgi:tetratricopeptide (TPR) repeat protein
VIAESEGFVAPGVIRSLLAVVPSQPHALTVSASACLAPDLVLSSTPQQEGYMRHAGSRSWLWLTTCGAISLLMSCSSGSDKARETATALPGDIAPANASEVPAEKGMVPVSTTSEEAKKLYASGLARADQLRAHEAHKLFQEAAAKDPKFAMVHYQLALNAPTLKEALAHVGQAAALAPTASEGERLAILGLQAGFNGEPAKSLDYAKQAVTRYPEDARARLTLANAYYFGEKDYESARKELERAIEIDPTFSPAYNMLGYSHAFVGDYSGAEKAFKKYIELVPNDPNPYDSYAELLMETGRFDESIQQYRKALSVDPHFAGSHFGIASDLIFQGKHDQALAETRKLDAAAQNDGERRQAMFTRTLVYVDQKKTESALSEMQKQYAMGAGIGDTAAMAGDATTMGDILLQAGKPKEAGVRYQQALNLQVNSGLSAEAKEDARLADHYNLGRVALGKKDLATAKEHAQAYLSGASERKNTTRIAQAHELTGMIALQENKFDDAIGEFGKANARDPLISYETALAYKGKGDQAKAKETFRKAAEMYPLPTLNYMFIRADAKKLAGK